MNLTKSTLALACVAGVVLATGQPAAASGSVSLVTCAGTAEQTYDPGLTDETRDIHITSALTFPTCVDNGIGGHTAVTSALITVDYTTPANCLVAPPITQTTVQISWNGGEQHSTADVTVVVTRSTGTTVVASTGTITSGLFAGDRFSDQVTYPTIGALECLLGEGITHVSGVAVLAVDPL